MTRRKLRRARRSRNAFARRLAQHYAAPASRFGCDALRVRNRWPLDLWCSHGMMPRRGGR